MNYLLTFVCYGAHLPGEAKPIVGRKSNRKGDPWVQESFKLEAAATTASTDPPYLLNKESANVVLKAILETSEHRQWHVFAAHVRTNHVHIVVQSPEKPERILTDFKAYASRKLNETEPAMKRWARHGSTRYLNGERPLAAAIQYVLHEQGSPIAVHPTEGNMP